MQISKCLKLKSILNYVTLIGALIRNNMLTWECLLKNKGAPYTNLP